LIYATNYIIRGNGPPSVHAEESALRKLRRMKRYRKFDDRKNIDILVIKLTKTGRLSYSRPCRDCITRLERSGLKINRIYYSNEFGSITSESLPELVASKGSCSRGTRLKNAH
jgi:hypothetical protein